ncbi:MAG: transcriptional repressor [Candidatus Margulisbacteria bacterium]|nr:transcriptional repressor [Candidatus Margulisiibacteriota bacterium]
MLARLYKSTPKRRAILDLLENSETYLSPEQIWMKLKEKFIKIGLPTVYRNLESLAGMGKAQVILTENRQLHYYRCHDRDHHHHFVCNSCKKVFELPTCPVRTIEAAFNYQVKIESHIFQVNGYCRECNKQGRKAV